MTGAGGSRPARSRKLKARPDETLRRRDMAWDALAVFVTLSFLVLVVACLFVGTWYEIAFSVGLLALSVTDHMGRPWTRKLRRRMQKGRRDKHTLPDGR